MATSSGVLLAAVAALVTAMPLRDDERPSLARTSAPAPAVSPEGMQLLGRLPTAFVPNLGQWHPAAKYGAKFGAMEVFLQDRGWTFTLTERRSAGPDARIHLKEHPQRVPEQPRNRGVAVRMTFVDASAPELVAEQLLPGRHNYFLGTDASKWRSDVPLYGCVRYRGIYDGVDVRVHEQDRHLEYDVLLAPQAQLANVAVAVEGIDRLHVDADGALVMETQLGPIRMPAPLTWETGPTQERGAVPCRYVLRGENRFGFEVTDRRPGYWLTVDPGLVYSTLLGGVGFDTAYALALDTQGAATVAGWTSSSDFPTTLGAFDTSFNFGDDAFVTKLAPTGASLLYSTFLGGSNQEFVYALALDAQGAATVAGYTTSTDFPTTPGAFDQSYNGGADAFVAKLSPTGANLGYSTFLGGLGEDVVRALVVDARGAAWVAGYTHSANFPTTPGAFATSLTGMPYEGDCFVSRLAPSGASLLYSTFLGGTGQDRVFALAVDAQGAATVAGSTTSSDFPTTSGAFDRSYHGGAPKDGDGFVTKFSPTGASLVYSTFLGGAGYDAVYGLALDAQGAATVAGLTTSADFPTTPGSFDRSYNGGDDAFVTQLAANGASLVYSTFLGGTNSEHPVALALDAQGAATVAGVTISSDFPITPGTFDTSLDGYSDGFVARLSPTGGRLLYSTYLGGSGYDGVNALALDSQGAATVAGSSFSPDFPTTPGAFGTTPIGSYDGFVTRLDMLPTGVASFGRSSPGCTGLHAALVTSLPRVGNASFALTCGNARPFTLGVCALTANRFASPTLVLGGVELWVDPSWYYNPLLVLSNAVGATEVAVPVPNQRALAGSRLFAQFLWVGSTAPPPCPPLGWSASNALEIVIQP